MTDLDYILSLEEEELALRKTHPSIFFTPNGAQEKFIAAVGSHDVQSGKVVTYLLSGGNGVGKTRMLSEIALNLAVGPQNEWFDHRAYNEFKRPCRIRLVSTQTALAEGMLRELTASAAPHLAEGYPKQAGMTWLSEWVFKNGSRIDVMSWQQGITQHAGAYLDALILDEPGPRGIYDEATARLRAGGPVIWGMTPVDALGGTSSDLGWVFDELSRAEDPGYRGAWKVMYADAEENCREHGVRGRVPHSVIEDRMGRLSHDPAQLQARLYGRHALEFGRVLKEFEVERHVIPAARMVPHPGWPRYFALDVHPSKPQCGLYCVLTPFGELWITDEIVSTELIAGVAAEIKTLFHRRGWPPELIIDPLAATPNPITGESILTTFRQHGLAFRTAGQEKSDKHVGIDKVREMLRGIEGRPQLLVSDECRFTISQMKRWMLDPRTLQPSKEHDDMPENLYRIVLGLPPHPSMISFMQRTGYTGRPMRSSLMV